MNELEKKQRKERDDIHIRLLAKYNLFMLTVIITTFVAYYQLVDMFTLETEMTVHVSMVIGFVFAGLVFLSFRTHKRSKKEKRQ